MHGDAMLWVYETMHDDATLWVKKEEKEKEIDNA